LVTVIASNSITKSRDQQISSIYGFENETVNVDDVIETSNHFCCIDMVIDQADSALSSKSFENIVAFYVAF